MARLDRLDTPITKAQLQGLEPVLTNLQGNILRGHGRDRSVHIFLKFTAEAQRVKDWIHDDIAGRITSTQQQLDEAEDRRQYGIPGSLFVNFFLSAAGYRYLDCDLTGHTQAFQDGMKEASDRLHDPQVSTWEEAYKKPIHAMLLLADDDESFLLRETRQYLHTIKPIADVLTVEHGRALRNEHGEHIEPFGYVDGRSQPLFFEKDIAREKTERDGTTVWPPAAGPSLVVVREPNRGEIDCGSYLVFRKLEQNVRAFKETEEQLAKTLGLTGEDKERAGALVVGRFEDGTPVVLQSSEGMHAPVPNNFTYADDPDGRKCPFQAHIRKVNPRGELDKKCNISPDDPESESQRRIARRGIPYDERQKAPKDDPGIEALPTTGVGLLFMCYQKDIAKQFEFLQAQLANNPNHLRDQTGIDPIIGHAQGGAAVSPQQWPAQWGAPREHHVPFNFYGLVTLKGGEYFFAPSIGFLRTI